MPVSSIRQILLASMCLLLPHVAAAQSLPSATASPQIGNSLAAPLGLPLPKPRWIFSLTIFPFQIAMPLARMEVYPVELTGEARASDKVGVAFIAGAGRSTHNDTADGIVIERIAFDAGLSARYYLLGDFSRGLTLGWELYYFDLLSIASDFRGGIPSGLEMRGVTTGPLVGFKYIWQAGFTVEAEAGVGRIVITKGSTFDEPNYSVLINLKAGWSF